VILSNAFLMPLLKLPASASFTSMCSGAVPLSVTVPPALLTNVVSVGWVIVPVSAVKSSVSLPPSGASITVTLPNPSWKL
jgi:hypothetical protein